MRTKATLGTGWLMVLLVVTVLAVAGCGESKESIHARCAAEGQAAVEAFLRNEAPAFFTNDLGSFVKLDGSGFYDPVWNIQGYYYLTLDRTGSFQRRRIPIRIFVTEGRLTAPGSTNVGRPRIEGVISKFQGARLFVSHPNLKP
jgi:hypothetical protein